MTLLFEADHRQNETDHQDEIRKRIVKKIQLFDLQNDK